MCHFPTSFPIKECLIIYLLTRITRRLEQARITRSTFLSIFDEYFISIDCSSIKMSIELNVVVMFFERKPIFSNIQLFYIKRSLLYRSLITCFLFPSCNVFVSFQLLSIFPLSYFRVINVIGC